MKYYIQNLFFMHHRTRLVELNHDKPHDLEDLLTVSRVLDVWVYTSTSPTGEIEWEICPSGQVCRVVWEG
jgi:hypothetical protein